MTSELRNYLVTFRIDIGCDGDDTEYVRHVITEPSQFMAEGTSWRLLNLMFGNDTAVSVESVKEI